MRIGIHLASGLLALLLAQPSRADVDVRVGAGSNCATASIQTAINNANNANGITNILIARNASYATNWLNITSKNVRLIGGYADCNQTQGDSVRTLISGVGGSKDSVIKVRGSTGTVAFHNLEISGGDATDPGGGNHGGGIEIEDGPHGLVYFENVWIHNNEAIDGGGLWIKNEHSGDPNDIVVWLSHNTRIYGNNARRIVISANDGDGGGIWCSQATVYMTGGVGDSTGSFIAGNSASDAGGGIRAENCKMYIATTSSSTPTISNNTAGGPGGGISVSGEKSLIDLYTQNPLAPTMLYNNVAGGVGGAIDIGSSAHVRAWDIILWNNTSRSGGGAVSLFDNDDYPNADFRMKGTLEDAPNASPGTALGVAVNCAAFHRCNRIVSNAAIESGGARRPGAALRLSANSGDGNTVAAVAVLDGTELVDNSGENLLELAGDHAFANFSGTAMFNNTVSAELLHAPFDQGSLSVVWSTIAGNSIGGAATFRSSMDGSAGSPNGTRFKNSILWQPGKRIYSVVNGTVNSNNTDYLLSNDLTGVPASVHNLVADPRFVDSANLDYHLRLDSPAVDYLAANASAPTADHLPRIVDLLGPTNDNFGIQDLGAYERQFACAADTVFCSGFD